MHVIALTAKTLNRLLVAENETTSFAEESHKICLNIISFGTCLSSTFQHSDGIVSWLSITILTPKPTGFLSLAFSTSVCEYAC